MCYYHRCYEHCVHALSPTLLTVLVFSIDHLVMLHVVPHCEVFYVHFVHYHMENRLKKESTLSYTGQSLDRTMVLLVHLSVPLQAQLPGVASLLLIEK
jgi:hypothetical protein